MICIVIIIIAIIIIVIAIIIILQWPTKKNLPTKKILGLSLW